MLAAQWTWSSGKCLIPNVQGVMSLALTMVALALLAEMPLLMLGALFMNFVKRFQAQDMGLDLRFWISLVVKVYALGWFRLDQKFCLVQPLSNNTLASKGLRLKSSSFHMFLHGNISGDDCAKELFKPSKDSVSLNQCWEFATGSPQNRKSTTAEQTFSLRICDTQI